MLKKAEALQQKPKAEIVAKIEKKAEKKVAKIQLLGDCKCCYIIALGPDGEKTDMALTTSFVDKYAPKKTGVYNIALEKLNKDAPDGSNEKRAQQWTYWAKGRALLTKAHPGRALFEGFNKNLIIFKYRSLKN